MGEVGGYWGESAVVEFENWMELLGGFVMGWLENWAAWQAGWKLLKYWGGWSVERWG